MPKETNLKFLFALLLITAFPVWIAAQPDLRGMDITIGNWWVDYDVNTHKPANDTERQILQWRTKIQRDNGFTMREKIISNWTGMAQTAGTSIMGGNPAAEVFVLQADWAMTLMRQKLLYPVSDIFNFKNTSPVERDKMPVPWNQAAINSFTFANKTYAFSVGVNLQNAQVIFFNKRLFREAGLDPDLPYDMQRDGTWTWANFIDICKKLTRDTNGDGKPDTYALPRDLSTDILDAIVSSNGATYVDKNSRNGRFVNASNRPEFLEALQFAIRLKDEGVMKQKPEGVTRWDWYKTEFTNGNVAMYIDESYVRAELQNMRDDWGMVLFPKGPRSSTYRVYTRENVMVIPATYERSFAEKIMYAIQLWYTPVNDDWKSELYSSFRDRRAVDETIELIRNPQLHMIKYYQYIPGLNRGAIAWEMWQRGANPRRLVESVSNDWNSKINNVNNDIF